MATRGCSARKGYLVQAAGIGKGAEIRGFWNIKGLKIANLEIEMGDQEMSRA